MPMPMAHSLLGATIIALVYPKREKICWLPILLGAFLANAPDFDFALVFWLGSKDWHRGFSHSILFAVIVLLTMFAATKFSKLRESIAFGLAFASHFVLDFITTKIGDGLELFWFFSSERIGLGWFGLSEKPSKLSALEILGAILIEFIIFASIFVGIFFWRKRRRMKM